MKDSEKCEIGDQDEREFVGTENEMQRCLEMVRKEWREMRTA